MLVYDCFLLCASLSFVAAQEVISSPPAAAISSFLSEGGSILSSILSENSRASGLSTPIPSGVVPTEVIPPGIIPPGIIPSGIIPPAVPLSSQSPPSAWFPSALVTEGSTSTTGVLVTVPTANSSAIVNISSPVSNLTLASSTVGGSVPITSSGRTSISSSASGSVSNSISGQSATASSSSSTSASSTASSSQGQAAAVVVPPAAVGVLALLALL